MDEPGVAVRWVTVGVVVAGVLAVLGLVALWPRGEGPDLGIPPFRHVDATVTGVDDGGMCFEPELEAEAPCTIFDVHLTSGPDRGEDVTFPVRPTQFEVPPIDEGDEVVLVDRPDVTSQYRYAFSDFQRSLPLLWLLAGFVVAVVAFGHWQGFRALVGLAASGLVLLAFVVPALVRDESTVLVALSGTFIIAFVALYLAHGVNRATTVALAGTLASLVITTLLALAAVSFTHLTGLADRNAVTLRVTTEALDLRGLLVAGIVVGALGVLDDVTVSQVSTVGALRRANPSLPPAEVYREAIRVGRDHVASVVNTLVLAYAAAALPLLLFFVQGSQPVARLLTGELVAVEVVRMLVGSIGLVLAVPITTALAAAVLRPDDQTHHSHHHGPAPDQGAPVTQRRRGDPWDDFTPNEWPW
jgi:uncharacterized membrane protein